MLKRWDGSVDRRLHWAHFDFNLVRWHGEFCRYMERIRYVNVTAGKVPMDLCIDLNVDAFLSLEEQDTVNITIRWFGNSLIRVP